jgi:hypothetical protein
MRVLAALLLLAVIVPGAEQIEAFGHRWTVPVASDWKLEDGVLRMLVERPQREPRRPIQFGLAETPDWQRVRIEADVRRIGGSLILVYAYKDATHFNYAHLSVDTAAKQPVHNGIFHVYGGERVRISPTTGPASLPSVEEWYRVQLNYDAETGEVNVLVNGQKNPSLRAIDLSLGAGKVGIGSFFETAMFRNVRITGTPAR